MGIFALLQLPIVQPRGLAETSAEQPVCQAFGETGKSVCGRFLQYWLDHGGLAQQGFPISDELSEKSDVDGKTYTVQYFERAVFEYHPENQPPNDVLLSLLGTLAFKEKYSSNPPTQIPDRDPGSQLFQQTGHRVGGLFLDHWKTQGGLAQQGYPISDEFQEVSPLNGKTYTVQYFERAVFEYHPENQVPYDVLLSQLGTLYFNQKHPPAPQHAIKTVFLVLMENHNWSDIKGNSSAPYINNLLLPQASYAEQYYNPPGIHPSEPNYLWLEAGTNFGITNDADPVRNHQATTNHLVTLLNNKGVAWKAYQEGIGGGSCPVTSSGLYAAKHNPMVFFDDVRGGNSRTSAYCIAHERPYIELASDLQKNTVAAYNFITPDLCDDMHNTIGCASLDSVRNGDTWLSEQIPIIMASQAYKDGGAILITWDEGEGGSDGPIGMIVLSPDAKGGGYSNTIHYTHSSTLRTVEEIFSVSPLLGDAARSNDLSDLFRSFP